MFILIFKKILFQKILFQKILYCILNMSAGFSEEMMRQRLQTLSNTTHSIQTLSLWLIHHQRKHANVILTTWLKVQKYFKKSVL